MEQWPLALALLGGLLSLKITVISLLGPYFGLTRAESVRTGFVLSQVRRCTEGWAALSAAGRQGSGQEPVSLPCRLADLLVAQCI